jgi:hypothetical protein
LQAGERPDPDTTAIGHSCERAIRDLQNDCIHTVPGEEIPGFGRIPPRQVDNRPVLKGMADCVKHVRLDPEGVAGLAGPRPDAIACVQDVVAESCGDYRPLGV